MQHQKLLEISFAGDIMCKHQQLYAVKAKYGHYDFCDYFSGIKHLLSGSDYVLANLETPVSPTPPLVSSPISFNAPSELLSALKDAHFSFLQTANNHCLDRGIRGMDETLENLDKWGLDHSGTYSSALENKVFVKNFYRGRVKMAVICSTYGTNSEHNGCFLPSNEQWRLDMTKKQKKVQRIKFDPTKEQNTTTQYIADDVSPAAVSNATNMLFLEKVIDKICQARKEVDIVVAMPHVGGQNNPAPGIYASFIVEEMRRAGADIVIAGHPHVPLKCIVNDGVLCAYSLGNLAFTPDVDFFFPNTLSEYGIILHTYWDCTTKKMIRASYNITKCVVGDDGITRVKDLFELYEQATNAKQRERLAIDAEAVVTRVGGIYGGINEYYALV